MTPELGDYVRHHRADGSWVHGPVTWVGPGTLEFWALVIMGGQIRRVPYYLEHEDVRPSPGAFALAARDQRPYGDPGPVP